MEDDLGAMALENGGQAIGVAEIGDDRIKRYTGAVMTRYRRD